MTHHDAGVETPVILLMGPTASGKSELAIELADRLPWDIVSVDSAMVYRGMDIGTAKPSRETRARVPHRLVDILEPSEPYSAARFRDDALREIRRIAEQGRVPLLVGGTMLYFRALTRGLARLPSADAGVRARLSAEARRLGWDALHARLVQIDPEAARRIHPHDPQRIQRALEVHELTGQTLSELQRAREPFGADTGLQFLRAVIAPTSRALLRERIAQRFATMLEQGLIDEVQALRERGDLDLDLPSMRSVGYRQVWRYLDGDLDRDEMVEKAVTSTRQLAKRQLTWLRSEPEAHWLDSESLSWQAMRDDLLGRSLWREKHGESR